jgi:hypothetical protein
MIILMTPRPVTGPGPNGARMIRIGKVISVKPEGNVMRNGGACLLLERRRIKHEQK